MASLEVGAARSRLAARESFFGGPLSTREQAKAPGWSAFVKPAPAPDKEAGKGGKGRSAAGSGAKPSRSQPTAPRVDPEQERRQKLRQRRDFSGLAAAAPPPPPAAGQQQTAAGPRQQQQQQQQRVKVSTKRPAGGGGGRMATAARGMAMEVTALGKGRKQAASDALRQRVGEMVAQGRGAPPSPAGAAGLGSPTGSGTAGGGGGAAAAAAAARAAREAAGAKAVMQNKPVRTATGMQTLQLVSRPAVQARGGAAGAAGGAALAAMRAGVAGSGSGGRGGAAAAGASPGSVTKGQRPVTGAGAPRRLQQQHPRAGTAGAAGARPRFRGAFYGGRQPPAALEARMQYNKRRLSLDEGEDLESFIASDEEEGGGWASEGGEDWRAALREATGGYDPSKFAHIDRLPDRDMEAAYDQIQAEERRALRIARTEDEREAEREALREAAKRERKRSKKGVHAFLDDGD